jgi:hypothetical protein
VAVRIGEAVRAIEDRGAGQQDTIEVRMGSINAGVEDCDGRGTGNTHRAIQLVPADLGKRPLVGV